MDEQKMIFEALRTNGDLCGKYDILHRLVDEVEVKELKSALENDYHFYGDAKVSSNALRRIFGWERCDEAKILYDKLVKRDKEEAEKETPEPVKETPEHSEETPVPEKKAVKNKLVVKEEDPYGIKAGVKKIVAAGNPKAKVDRDEVLKLYKEGNSAREIADEMGRGYSTITMIIKELREAGRL